MGRACVKRTHHVLFTSCVCHAKFTFLPSIIFLYGATSKYLTMDITDTSDDDELVSGLSRNSDVSLIEDICLASLALSFRENKLLAAQMNWHRHVQSLLHENLFHVKYRMSLSAFDKRLDLLSPKLKLNAKFARMAGSKPISTEIMLHCNI